MKKLNVLIASSLLIGGLATTKVEAKKKTEITFWHAMNGAQEETLKELTKGFEKENPNIKVKLQNQGDYGNLQAKMTTASTNKNNLPNLMQGYVNWQENNIKKGYLLDLRNEIDDNAYLPQFLAPLKKGGKIYGVPFAKSTEVLVYNTEVFERLGIEVPKTYNEYLNACKKIHKETGMYGGGFDHLGNLYQTYLKNKGIAVDNKLNVKGKVSKEAFNYIKKGVRSKAFKLAGTERYLSGSFANEQVASYVGSNGGLSFTKKGVGDKFKWAVAPYPAEKVMQQGTDLFVFDKKDKEDKASVKYIEYLTNEKSQIKWGLKTGYIPVNNKALNSKEYAQYEYADVLKANANKAFTPTTSIKDNKLYLDSGVYMEKYALGGKLKTILNDFKRAKENIYK